MSRLSFFFSIVSQHLKIVVFGCVSSPVRQHPFISRRSKELSCQLPPTCASGGVDCVLLDAGPVVVRVDPPTFSSGVLPNEVFLDLDSESSSDEDVYRQHEQDYLEVVGRESGGGAGHVDEDNLDSIYPFAWALDGRRIGENGVSWIFPQAAGMCMYVFVLRFVCVLLFLSSTWPRILQSHCAIFPASGLGRVFWLARLLVW